MENKKQKLDQHAFKASGWIKLYRQIRNKNWWKKERFTRGQAWVDILLSANHSDKTIILDDKEYSIPKGSFITSQQKLSKRWHWGIATVSRFLQFLKKTEQCLEYNTEHSRTHIFILNWDKYQSDTKKLKRKRNRSWKGSGKVVETNKNDVKNDYKNIYNSYIQKINQQSKLTKQAKTKIQLRLKEYTEIQLLQAIDNFSQNKWWMEHNSKRGIAWFFNSEDRIDQFLNLNSNSLKQLSPSQIQTFLATPKENQEKLLIYLQEHGFDTSTIRQN